MTKENPTTEITLHFRDGSALSFRLEQPVPQFEMFKWIGRFLSETNNPVDVGMPAVCYDCGMERCGMEGRSEDCWIRQLMTRGEGPEISQVYKQQ